MKIKICQMSETYHSPLTFRICINECNLLWFKYNKVMKYSSSCAINYIRTLEQTGDDNYSSFIYSGRI